jgi:protein BCP1
MVDSRAVAVHSYPLKTAPPRDDESFGVEQFGRLVLVETAKLAEAVGAMEEACQP